MAPLKWKKHLPKKNSVKFKNLTFKMTFCGPNSCCKTTKIEKLKLKRAVVVERSIASISRRFRHLKVEGSNPGGGIRIYFRDLREL